MTSDQHACCHKGKAAPEKACSHVAATQKAELPPGPVVIAPMVSAYSLAVIHPLVAWSAPAAPPRQYSPPPIIPLVLRI